MITASARFDPEPEVTARSLGPLLAALESRDAASSLQQESKMLVRRFPTWGSVGIEEFQLAR
ncbi:MAG: hypothetical protein KDD44_06600 [Bdellovibrionales bacterium]|nr:hypothetical protein [Bdellovibrionales bacterium]